MRQDSFFYWLYRFCGSRRNEEPVLDPDLSELLLANPRRTERTVRSSMLTQKTSNIFQLFCSLLGHLSTLGNVAAEACGLVKPWSTWVLQVRCALVQLLAMSDILTKTTMVQMEVLSELRDDMPKGLVKSCLQIAASNFRSLSNFQCQVAAKRCECEKLTNLCCEKLKMQHAVMRIIEIHSGPPDVTEVEAAESRLAAEEHQVGMNQLFGKGCRVLN